MINRELALWGRKKKDKKKQKILKKNDSAIFNIESWDTNFCISHRRTITMLYICDFAIMNINVLKQDAVKLIP